MAMNMMDMTGGDIGTAPPWMRMKPMKLPNYSSGMPVNTQPTPAGGDPIGYGGTAPMVATDPAFDPYAPVASATFDQPNRTGDGLPQINPAPTAIDQGVNFGAPAGGSGLGAATRMLAGLGGSAAPEPAPIEPPASGGSSGTVSYVGPNYNAVQPWNAGAAGAPAGGGSLDVSTAGLPGISTDYTGDAQRGADAAYKNATQFFDQDFTRDNSALETKLINQGFAPGTEAFTNEMEKQKRGQNAMRENAAFAAQGVGFDQAGQLLSRALASRAALYGERSDNANRSLAARGQDKGVEQAGLGASASMANAASAADANRYSTDASTTVALRRLGLDSSNADVNNLIALVNSSRGGVNMPNFGAPNPLDVAGANSIASGNANAAANRSATDRATLAQLGGAALGAYFRS